MAQLSQNAIKHFDGIAHADLSAPAGNTKPGKFMCQAAQDSKKLGRGHNGMGEIRDGQIRSWEGVGLVPLPLLGSDPPTGSNTDLCQLEVTTEQGNRFSLV